MSKPSESGASKPSIIRGAVRNILGWFGQNPVRLDRRSEQISVQVNATEAKTEGCEEWAPAEAEAVVAESTAHQSIILSDVNYSDAVASHDNKIDRGNLGPDKQEVQRRRDLIRTLFNDFWSAFDEKPSSFAARLDQAETYLNERLAACGEAWTLDAGTRQVLGLPPRSN
jgi:hypothetical protein